MPDEERAPLRRQARQLCFPREETDNALLPKFATGVVRFGTARARRLCSAAGRDGSTGAGLGIAARHGAGAQGTVFFHDFEPGTYRFTVQPYGTPTNYVDTLQLGPGTEAYVQVEPVPNWEVGSTSGGGSFIVATMSPQEAQQYMPMMKDLGQR